MKPKLGYDPIDAAYKEQAHLFMADLTAKKEKYEAELKLLHQEPQTWNVMCNYKGIPQEYILDPIREAQALGYARSSAWGNRRGK